MSLGYKIAITGILLLVAFFWVPAATRNRVPRWFKAGVMGLLALGFVMSFVGMIMMIWAN